MEILNKADKMAVYEYESFLKEKEGISFMQSLGWTAVKSNWNSEAVIVRDSKGKIAGTCLILIKELPFFDRALLYAPRGPVCDYNNIEVMREFFSGIDSLSKKYGAFEFICDPPVSEKDKDFAAAMKELGFSKKTERAKSKTETVQCRNNYVLNIDGKNQNDVMNCFKSDWRNRIRKAERKGVYCKFMGAEGLKDFYPLMAATGKRDNFPVRSLEYFRRFTEGLGDNCRLFICYADIDGKETPLSAAIGVNYSGVFTYVYGASSDENRNLYPNYLMQWTMIRYALEKGCKLYDFGGIPCYDDEKDPKYGIYRFKKGFGGEIVNYAGDFVKRYDLFLCGAMWLWRRVNIREFKKLAGGFVKGLKKQ
ncbi:MAG: peptidoglycan bridge formation glycyltransferase FemA/FemB family protein [Ruminiclostridium sp.]|nr:peptidoglycan bridge formation glycyltransferase FemA/FemB family protein [Ruminiclostridium sp.]